MDGRRLLGSLLGAMALLGAGAQAAEAQVRQVSTGGRWTCVVKPTGMPVCFGEAGNTPPTDIGTVKTVSVGFRHACAIKANDTVACWGDNGLGQRAVPADLGTVTAISVGQQHSCAIKTGGIPVCWGRNTEGQTTIPAGLTARAISGGTFHTCALTASAGTPVCWGAAPAVPADLGAVKTIVAGRASSCVITGADVPRCFGEANTPRFPGTTPGTATAIALGNFAACAIRPTRAVDCYQASGTPLTVPADFVGASAIDADANVCVVKADGYVGCGMGFDQFGEWGVPPEAPGPVPPNASVGEPYSHALTTTAGTPAGTFSVSAGALPPGLALSAAGVLSGTPTAQGTFTFTIKADNDVHSPATRQTSVQVGVAPAVTAQPADRTVVRGSATTFTVDFTGSPAPTVQWQRKAPGADTFTDVAGATATSLPVTNVSAEQDGTQFQAVVTNAIRTVRSRAATLTVDVPAEVVGQPADTFVTAGEDATFTVAATGAPAPDIIWQRRAPGETGFTDVPGATGATLVLPDVTPGQDGTQVRAVADNRAGPPATSALATLTVDLLPTVRTGPDDQRVAQGADASFSVVADGVPVPTLQWQRKAPGEAGFTDVPGATGTTLVLGAVTATQDGTQVRAIATNRAGSATSRVATLTVSVPAPAPPPPPPPSPILGAADTVAPVLSGVVVPARVRRGRPLALAFVLGEAAKVQVRLTRTATGVRKGGRCVAGRATRAAQRCRRPVVVRTLAPSLGAGARRITVATARLPLGPLTVAVTATDAAGNAGTPVVRRVLVRRR